MHFRQYIKSSEVVFLNSTKEFLVVLPVHLNIYGHVLNKTFY